LKGQARERYGRLDWLSSERNWLQDQYDALDVLVEALSTNNGWLEYRAEVMRDQLLELDARAAKDTSAVEKVRTALLERDEALRRAREDLAGAQTLAAEWETEVATTCAELQQDRATLEGARAWRSEAEEKAKEVKQLRTNLADKTVSLTSTEEQLRQERDACQQTEAQLQQERTAFAEARATLERERLAREEA
jgi:chromosome segregation ATPase